MASAVTVSEFAPDQSRPRSSLPLVALLVANSLLAFGPWFARTADVGPVAVVLWRLILALPFLMLLTLARGGATRVPIAPLMGLIVGGMCLAVDLSLWYMGIRHTRLANGTLFATASGFFFPLYGFAIARAWPKPSQAFALLLAALGILLLLGRSAQLSMATLRGDLLCLAGGALYTPYLIVFERCRTVHPNAALTIATAAGAVPLFLASLWLDERMLPNDWMPLILLAASSQILGQALMIYAVARLPALLVGLAFLLQPVISASIGWTVYGERLGPLDLAGAASIAIAVLLVRSRPVNRLDIASHAKDGEATTN